MNEYLTSPVTPIVVGVVAGAVFIAVVIKIRSNRRKEQERQAAEQRRIDAAVRKRIDDERSGRFAASRRKRSVPASGRPGFKTDAPRRRDDVDHDNGLFIPSLIVADSYSDPTPSRDSGSSSSYDGGSSSSSSSYDSGSSSSSSDSGSSSCGGGGGGGD